MPASPRDLASSQSEDILSRLGALALELHQIQTVEALLEAGARAAREIFESDRALVYQILPGSDGVVLAESTSSGTPAMVGHLIGDPCLEARWMEPYRQGRTHAIDDIDHSSLEPCHLKLLAQLQVKANLVAPIVVPAIATQADHLWGLLILHECQPRAWQPLHHQVLKHLGIHLGLALRHCQMQQALSQSHQRETRWQTALEAAADGVWDWNVASNRVFFSHEWKTMLGYSEQEIGDTLTEWSSRVHPDDLEYVNEALQQHLAGHTAAYRSEHRMRAKDGSWHWILDRGKVVTWQPDGNPLRMVGTHVDITPQKCLEQLLRERDDKLRKISEQIPGVIYQYRLHPSGQSCFPYASEAIRHIYEVTPEQVKTNAQPVLDRLHSDDRDRVVEGILKSFNTLEIWQDEYRVCLPERGLRWLEGHAMPEKLADGSVLWHGYIQDITPRKHMEALLEREMQQERMITLIDHRIMASLDLETILQTTVDDVRQFLDTDRVLVYRLNPDWSGVVMTESVGPEWMPLLSQTITDSCFVRTQGKGYHDNHVNVVNDVYAVGFSACHLGLLAWMQVRAKLVVPIVQDDHLWGLLIAHHCQGPRQWQESESRLLQQLAHQLALAIQHAELHQQLQAANQELEQISNTDALTQVHNRRYFDQHLLRTLHQARQTQHPLALILCDIDYFKQYNDTYGHPAGDTCLMAVAQALQQCLKRPTDVLARYGGEEFAIILPHTNLSGAIAVVQQIQRAIAALHLHHSAHPSSQWVTLSFGLVARVPTGRTSPQALIDQADQALYQAKAAGRNRYCCAALPAE